MDVRPVLQTVTLACPVMPVFSAVIVAVPADTPITKPELLIVATLVWLDDQLAEIVDRLPSLKLPVAFIWSVEPMLTEGVVFPLVSDTVIEFSVGLTQKSEQPAIRHSKRFASANHTRVDRLLSNIPTSRRESHGTRIQRIGA